MKFSELTRLNEGYDLKAIKEQIAGLFKGKLYTSPSVVMEDGTPVVEISIRATAHNIFVIRLALDNVGKENELYIDVNIDFPKLRDFYKYCDSMKKIVEDIVEPYEDDIIEILKSK